MDLSHDTGFGGLTMSSATDVQATGGIIQHISRNKQLLFEWNAFNYCRPNEMKPIYISSNNRLDWTHGNSIFVADDGNLIYSIRNFDQILKISRSDSSVMGRLGGKRSDFTFVGDSGFDSQHFAYTNGNRVGLFDNGSYHHPQQARAVEYLLDSNLLTANLVYEYKADSLFTAHAQGSNQVLPDKGRLINWAGNQTIHGQVTELDSSNKIVARMNFGGNYKTYRAFYFDLPWKMYRPSIRCFSIDTQLYLVAPPTASRFIWSSGDTTRIININIITIIFTIYRIIREALRGYQIR
jgi:hypothetical protein